MKAARAVKVYDRSFAIPSCQADVNVSVPLINNGIEIILFESVYWDLAVRLLPDTPIWADANGNLHVMFVSEDAMPLRMDLPDRDPICEVRIAGDVLVPPSVWRGKPLKVLRTAPQARHIAWVELTQRLFEIAATVALAQMWPSADDDQNWAALMLAGALAEMDVPPEDAERIIGHVAEFGDDFNSSERVAVIDNTYNRHARGAPIAARRKLENLLGRRFVSFALGYLVPGLRLVTTAEFFPQFALASMAKPDATT